MRIALEVAGVLAILALAALLVRTWLRLREIRKRFAPVLDMDAELHKLQAQRAGLVSDLEDLDQRRTNQRKKWEVEFNETVEELKALTHQLDLARDEVTIQSYGLYEPQFEFDTSEDYKTEIKEIRSKQKAMVKQGTAAVGRVEWTVQGSKREGQKLIRRQLKLQLRAFNGECDVAVAKVRYDNVAAMKERINRSFDAINKLGETNQCEITTAYLKLKLRELKLAYEYQEKKQAEKEEQAHIREQMREEERAQREHEKAMADAEKEEQRYEKALAQARTELETAQGAKQAKLESKLAELQARLAEAQANKQRAISQAQLTKSGHVYVISNIGSFGEDVYKIGMTRRLEPLDRVRELGDASVPFPFDVHAMIHSEDAPGLEAALHQRFSDRRLNRINHRKEFFQVSLSEVEDAVVERGADIEFTRIAEAEQFRRSVALRRKDTEEAAPTEHSVVVEAKERFERLRSRWNDVDGQGSASEESPEGNSEDGMAASEE